MMDRKFLKQAGRRLAQWRRTMILTHERPDGDALGAIGAMKHIIECAGRQARAYICGDIPQRYEFLQTTCGFEQWQEQESATVDARFDGILILDTCSWQQLEQVAPYLKASLLPKIIVDHHTTRDDLQGAGTDDLYVVDASASAACGLVYAWCELMRWTIDVEAAEALFTGLAADTGWFRFSNTDGPTLQSAAALVEMGVRPDVIHARLEASHRLARLPLKAAMLNTLEYHAGGKAAVMWLTKAMFEQAGAMPSDAEDLVNEPMSARSVAVSILMTDQDDGKIRVNFRSKSPEVCGRDVDVAAMARSFGGGGHRRAAGARVAGTLEDVRRSVTKAVVDALR